jgi:hypothetical protein
MGFFSIPSLAIKLGLPGILITAGGLFGGFSGWFNGAGTPVSGPAHAQCDAGLAPSDVTQPANNCGVQPLKIQRPIFHDHLKSLETDLYIEGATTCLLSVPPVACGVDDNRSFVDKNNPDPHAHPSRNRVHLVFDFESGEVTAIISPSCRIHPLGAGTDNQKECFAPKRVGEGTNFDVTTDTSNPRAWTIHIQVTWYRPTTLPLLGQSNQVRWKTTGICRLTLSPASTVLP